MAMAKRTITVMTCDFCSHDDETVANRRFDLDGKKRQLEACENCWPVATVKELIDTSRGVRGRTPKQRTNSRS